MVSKTVIAVLLITALILSSVATYITLTKINETPITGGFNKAGVGLRVEPAKKSNVGVTVLPTGEKKEEER